MVIHDADCGCIPLIAVCCSSLCIATPLPHLGLSTCLWPSDVIHHLPTCTRKKTPSVCSYARLARCSGHSSYITHLDWSVDGRVLQSNCGAYELLYFEAASGKQIRQNQRDTQWSSWTCSLGFPVMGMWRDDTDGTDINAVCRCGRRRVGPGEGAGVLS